MKKREIAILVVILLIDLLTKYYFSTTLQLHESVPIIDGFLYFTYVQNTGAGWSILQGQMIFFYIISVIGLVAFGYFLWKSPKSRWFYRLALVLMIAGLLGNFYDRLVFQYVRDFIDVYIFGYDFPIFNIADSSLCIGVFFMAIDMLRHPEEV